MKVALIAPPYPIEEAPSAPLGLCYVAAAFEKAGARVKILDYVVRKYSPEKLNRELSEFLPDIIGITSVTLSHNTAVNIIKTAKAMFPEVLTVMGGPHVSFDYQNTLLSCPEIDLAVIGEGEQTIGELVPIISNRILWPSIRGIAFKDGERIVATAPREFIRDLDRLPLPARHLLDTSRYRALGFPVSIVTSRGCPNRCIFCQGHRMVGNRVRYRSPEKVVDEIEELLTSGYTHINISDDFFTCNKNRVKSFCGEIKKRNLAFSWTAFARADSVNQNLLKIMQDAGCDLVFFGIESGNQQMLDRINKRVTLDRIRQAVADCKAVGMDVFGSFILGLPGETMDTLMDSHRFASELQIKYGYHFLSPFPGTELMENIHRYDLKLLTKDWSMFDANRAIVQTQNLKPKEIETFYECYYLKIIREIEQDIEKRFQQNLLDENERQSYLRKIYLEMVITLLSEDIIESINPIPVGEDPPEYELSAVLSKKIERPFEFILPSIRRLSDSGCLSFEIVDNCTAWRWS